MAASNVVPFPRGMFDSFANFLAGFGIWGRDKSLSQRFVLDLLDQQQLDAAYRSDWISRKIVDIPAFDSTRAWRSWQAEKEQIGALEKSERDLQLQLKMLQAISKARLYGGAALIIGIKNQDFKTELDPETVGKDDLAFVHVVSRWRLSAGARILDITSPWYGEPSYYQRSNPAPIPAVGGVQQVEESGLGYYPGETLFIHPSRVVKLTGLDYPDIEMSPDAWGDSVLQPVHDAIRGAGLVNSSIATVVAESKLDVISVPGLTNNMQSDEGAARLYARFSGANAAKSVVNATLIDTEEKWERKELSLTGHDKVMAMFLQICAGAADIPATRLLGQSPAGMDATGASDIRNYYDRLDSDRAVRLTPAMSRLDEVLIRHTFGSRPEEIHYNWNSLWQMDDSQKADVHLKKAQAFKIHNDSGLINEDVLRDGLYNQLVEDGVYPGLEAAEEEHGGIEPEEVDEMALQQQMTQMGQPPKPTFPRQPKPAKPRPK